MKTLVVLSLLFLMLVIGCKKNDNDTMPNDTVYTFSQGDSKTIPTNSNEVTTINVKMDSVSDRRCHPCGNCYSVFGSTAFFLVSLNKGASYDTVKLSRWDCGDDDIIKGSPIMDVKNINGINFGLVNILMVPENGQRDEFVKIIIYQ